MITQSGADVSIQQDAVVKTGAGVSEQGEFIFALRNVGVTCVPEVTVFLRDGYVMPRYTQTDPTAGTHTMAVSTAFMIAETLQDQMWSRSPWTVPSIYEEFLKFDAASFNSKLARVRTHHCGAAFNHVMTRTRTLVGCIDFEALQTGMTHGDPTVENSIMSDGIILDPIRPSGAVPAFPAADMGKILQSIVGYEQRKYDGAADVGLAISAGREFLDEVARDENERTAAQMFGALAFLRTVPYYRESISHLLIGAINVLCL